MSVIEIYGCDLKKRQFTSVNDGKPVEGLLTCEDSNTGKALLKTDLSKKILFCSNRECNWNNDFSKRFEGDNLQAILTKETVSDFT